MVIKTSKKFAIGSFAALCIVLAGCDPEFSNPVGSNADSYTSGDADFSRFVTLGDSLTAGFADGALYLHGQQNSFPAIVAEQLTMAGGGTFTQPLVNDNIGGLLLGGNPLPGFGNRLVLTGTPLAPAPVSGTPTTEIGAPLPGPFNNVGVAGAKSYHLVTPNYGDVAGVVTMPATANPYFVRFRSTATTTMLADAAGQAPTFFVLWIGGNDTLSYATSGGSGVDQLGNPDPSTYSSTDITDPTAFAGIYSSVVTALTAGGAKGVLLTIPDVTAIAYFNTVPFNAIPMDQATADISNGAYAAYNGGLLNPAFGLSADEIAARTISFAPGQNALVIEDLTLTDLSGFGLPSIRQATATDFVVLPALGKIGTEATPGDPTTVWGVGTALLESDVLTADEAALVLAANAAFNAAITGIAAANPDLALLDMKAIFDEIAANGLNYGTGSITATFGTGGAFSLDGIHPTARGHAVIANLIIDLIESEFGAVLPPVDPGQFTTTFIQ